MKIDIVSSVVRIDPRYRPSQVELGLDKPKVGTLIVDGTTTVHGWLKHNKIHTN